MSRRPTRAELEERCAALAAERDVLALALYYWQRGDAPEYAETCKLREASGLPLRLTVSAYGLARYDGGIVIEADVYPGEAPTARVCRTDAWIASARRTAELLGGVHHARAAIADRLAAAQHEALETRHRGTADTTDASKR